MRALDRMRFARASGVLAALALSSIAPANASAAPLQRAAIVVTQAVGVGPLADRLGNFAADKVAAGSLAAMDPGEALRLLREKGGPDPLRCGSDAACLRALGELLEVRWLIAVGIGKFGEVYGLEVAALELGSVETAPSTTSSTFAAPGPDWQQALAEALGRVLPPELLRPPGRVVVRANVEGAELLIGGRIHGATPLGAPLLLPEGRYELELRKPGFSVARREVVSESAAESSIDFILAPIAEPRRVSELRTWSYVAGGGTVAALLGAAFFHAGASSSMDTARTNKNAGRPFADDRDDALSQIGSARILYGIAGVAAASAVTLYVLDSLSQPQGP